MKVLIAYATGEGQTRKIATSVADWVRGRGHDVFLLDSASMAGDFRAQGFGAFIIAGSLHYKKHQKSLIRFVKKNRGVMLHAPGLFLSVSSVAVREDEDGQAIALSCIGKFIEQTGWLPTVSMPVGGAMMYTKYKFVLRALLKKICEREGGPTDTSRDYEFTDWTALESAVSRFLSQYVDSANRRVKHVEDPAILVSNP